MCSLYGYIYVCVFNMNNIIFCIYIYMAECMDIRVCVCMYNKVDKYV